MNPRVRAAAVAAGVVLLDRLTKIYIQQNFSLLDVVPVIPGFFNIVHVENPGAAFGMLAESPSSWRGPLLAWISLVVMVVIGLMLWRAKPGSAAGTPLAATGLALVFGGALGNVWDRIFRGSVTDFIQLFFGFYEFPSFNVADSAIDIGAGLLLIDMWRGRKPRE
jgi:signal peptidase II